MSLPVPLGVRIYTYGRTQFDRWVTPWVSDLSFRSVIPGGFASATIKLTRPRTLQTPEVVTGTATATGAGTASTLPCADADAGDINVGDRVWIYTSGGSIRYGGDRFRVTGKTSLSGTTTIAFTPAASGTVASGDVMRAAAPGHFSYGDPVIYDEIANLFNRVQVVDLRTAEIVWEGRIEDPERDSDDDSWTLGCLGAMVAASDIQRPIFYIDGDFNNWYVLNPGGYMDTEIRTPTYARFQLKDGVDYGTGVGADPGVWMWWGRAETADCYIGRFDITYDGSYINANIRTDTYVTNGGGSGQQNSVDVTAWNGGAIRKTNLVVTDFTSTTAQRVAFWPNIVTSGNVAAGAIAYGTARDAHIQVMRLDRNGSRLTAAASYPADYVTVPQIVEDVVGRYLVSGWLRDFSNVPFSGQVRPSDIYIDASGTAQITHLTYYDGATAADILNELIVSAQPDAYWAIWESNFRATAGGGGVSDFGFRFEWATWPSGWGYLITSLDGLEEKPSGEDSYNFLFYKYNTDAGWPFYLAQLQSFWDGSNSSPLEINNVTRALTISKEPATSNALNEAAAKITGYGRTKNSGTVTVKRPVQFYDTGMTSISGASRMLDPWQIRPGKLARITDIPVPSRANDFLQSPEQFAIDNFGRSVSSGWGNADAGGAWDTSGGSASDYSVTGALGRQAQTTVAVLRASMLPGVFADADAYATVSTSATATGASHTIRVAARFVDANNYYMAEVTFSTTQTVALALRKNVAGSFTTLASQSPVSGLTHGANTQFRVRFQVTGSTIRAKIWLASAAEPSDWTVSAADTTITTGQVGVRARLETGNTNTLPVNVDVRNFQAVGVSDNPGAALDSVAFRVVATEYRSSDNSCTLELDQVATWRTETQIANSAAKKSTLVVKG